MKVSVYYEEVSNYVEKHYLVRPSIKQVDDKTLSIEYTPHKFIPTISVAVRIEAMRKAKSMLSMSMFPPSRFLCIEMLLQVLHHLPRHSLFRP